MKFIAQINYLYDKERRLAILLMVSGLLTGCSVNHQAGVDPGIQKALVVKTLASGSLVCLQQTEHLAQAANDEALVRNTLNELCLSYQADALTLAEYRDGILAAPSLLLAAKAGAFLLASSDSQGLHHYTRLVEILEAKPSIKSLCRKMMMPGGDPHQRIFRLCSEVLRVSAPSNFTDFARHP